MRSRTTIEALLPSDSLGQDGQHNDSAGDHELGGGVYGVDVEDFAEVADGEHAEDREDDPAAAAGEGGAADDDHGDGGELVADAAVGVALALKGAEEDSGEAGESTAEGVGDGFGESDGDSGVSRGLFVVADGVDVETVGGAAEEQECEQGADEEGDDVDGEFEASDVEAGVEHFHEGGVGVLGDDLALGEVFCEAAGEGHHGEGGDEGLDSDLRDEEAGDGAGGSACCDGDGDGGPAGPFLVEDEHCEDDARERDDGADGQVDAAADDDDGEAAGEDAVGAVLPEHVGVGAGAEEDAVGVEDGADDGDQDHAQEREEDFAVEFGGAWGGGRHGGDRILGKSREATDVPDGPRWGIGCARRERSGEVCAKKLIRKKAEGTWH